MTTCADDQQSHKKTKSFAAVLFRALLLATLLFGIGQIDPFGLSTATNKHSRALVYQVIAPYKQSDHRNEITILMLDDQDLAEFGQSWPTEYGFHAAILQTLKDLKVAAVFIDIGFLDERLEDGSFSDLTAVIDDYHEEKIPLLMAGTPGEGLPWLGEETQQNEKPAVKKRCDKNSHQAFSQGLQNWNAKENLK